MSHRQSRRGDPVRVCKERPEHWALGLRLATTQERISFGRWKPDIPLVVSEALRVNIHTSRRVVCDQDYHTFRNLWQGATLPNSIYQLVADAAAGGRVVTCELRGDAFVQTDARQRFCPPSVNKTARRCGTRYKVEKCRTGKAARNARAKRTRPRKGLSNIRAKRDADAQIPWGQS